MGLNDEHTHSSRLKALTAPERWGLERVVIFFGKTISMEVQTCIEGDLVRDKQTGLYYTFLWRQGENLGLEPFNRGKA